MCLAAFFFFLVWGQTSNVLPEFLNLRVKLVLKPLKHQQQFYNEWLCDHRATAWAEARAPRRRGAVLLCGLASAGGNECLLLASVRGLCDSFSENINGTWLLAADKRIVVGWFCLLVFEGQFCSSTIAEVNEIKGNWLSTREMCALTVFFEPERDVLCV